MFPGLRRTAAALLVTVPGPVAAQCPTLEAHPFCGSWPEVLTVFGSASCDLGSGEELFVGGRGAVTCTGAIQQPILRRTSAGWSGLGSGLGHTHAQYMILSVYAITVHDDGTGRALYVGGEFTHAGGQAASSIARWNGSTWTPLGGNWRTIWSLCSHDDGSGPALYAAGWFGPPYPSSPTGLGIARWRNGVWESVGAAPQGLLIRAMTTFSLAGTRVLACGGSLYTGTALLSTVQVWDGQAWTQLGGSLGPTIQTSYGHTPENYSGVQALLEHDDGSGPALYVGGHVTAGGSSPFQDLARWRNGAWEPFGGVTDVVGRVRAFAVHDDGAGGGRQLYVAGRFGQLGNATGMNVARWDGATWEGLSPIGDPTLCEEIRALVSHDPPGRDLPDLWLAGAFRHWGPVLEPEGLARWRNCDTVGAIVCNGNEPSPPCPCSNASPAIVAGGCLNSSARPGLLRARGRASIAGDTLVLFCDELPAGVPLAFVQGTATIPASVFGEGRACAGGALVRIATRGAGGAHDYPAPGEPAVSLRGGVAAPGTRTYQVLHRDPGGLCAPANATNALEIAWGA